MITYIIPRLTGHEVNGEVEFLGDSKEEFRAEASEGSGHVGSSGDGGVLLLAPARHIVKVRDVNYASVKAEETIVH